MDDQNAGRAAHRGQAVNPVQNRQSVRCRKRVIVDKAILQIDIDKRRALRNHREVRHATSLLQLGAGLPEDVVCVLPSRRRLGTGAVQRYAGGPAARARPPAARDEGAARSYFLIGVEVDQRTG